MFCICFIRGFFSKAAYGPIDIPVITIIINEMTAMIRRDEVFLSTELSLGILICWKCFERIESDDIKARNIPGYQ